ncbi:zinc transporter ZIP1-like [Arapaima gigas]
MAEPLSLLGPLILLLSGTLVCGLAPLLAARETRRCITPHAAQRRVHRLANCLADGMFLATCFLDLVPQYLAEMKEAFRYLQITLQFPLPEFIMAMGFFILLVMEQTVHACREESRASQVDRQALVMVSSIRLQGQEEQSPRSLQHSFDLMLKENCGPQESSGIGHWFLRSRSGVHCFILVLTLSLHSLFEGLKVGLKSDDQQMLAIATVLLLHKGAVALSLMLQLTCCHLLPATMVGGLFVFAATSPLGIGLGTAFEGTAAALRHHLAYSTLQGLTTGCFIYITFMEILPRDLCPSQNHIPKLLLLLIGFAVVTGLLFIKI